MTFGIFAFADDLVLVAAKIPLALDEEGGVAGVAEGRLQHHIPAQRLAELLQLFPALHFRKDVGDRGYAGLLADAHGLDLVVHPAAQAGLGEPDLEPVLLGQLLGLLVEHQEDALGVAAAGLDEVDHLFVLEQVVVDVLDALELGMRVLVGHHDVRMAAVVTVDVGDVLEVTHPFVDPQQVEVGGADEIDRRLVAVEETPDLGDVLELLAALARGTGFCVHGLVFPS